MSPELVMSLGQESIKTMMLLSAPLLICAVVVGLLISVFQAVTQINEATLSFVPKIVAIVLTLIFCGPWMIDVMSRFTITLFDNISTYVR